VGSGNQSVSLQKPWLLGFPALGFGQSPDDPPMFRHTLLPLLSSRSALMSRSIVGGKDREILALRQQVLILHRQLGKRPRLVRAETLALRLTCLRMKMQHHKARSGTVL